MKKNIGLNRCRFLWSGSRRYSQLLFHACNININRQYEYTKEIVYMQLLFDKYCNFL